MINCFEKDKLYTYFGDIFVIFSSVRESRMGTMYIDALVLYRENARYLGIGTLRYDEHHAQFVRETTDLERVLYL